MASNTLVLQITANVLSDMNYIHKLHGNVREIVFKTWVDSFKNTHCKSLVLDLVTRRSKSNVVTIRDSNLPSQICH